MKNRSPRKLSKKSGNKHEKPDTKNSVGPKQVSIVSMFRQQTVRQASYCINGESDLASEPSTSQSSVSVKSVGSDVTDDVESKYFNDRSDKAETNANVSVHSENTIDKSGKKVGSAATKLSLKRKLSQRNSLRLKRRSTEGNHGNSVSSNVEGSGDERNTEGLSVTNADDKTGDFMKVDQIELLHHEKEAKKHQNRDGNKNPRELGTCSKESFSESLPRQSASRSDVDVDFGGIDISCVSSRNDLNSNVVEKDKKFFSTGNILNNDQPCSSGSQTQSGSPEQSGISGSATDFGGEGNEPNNSDEVASGVEEPEQTSGSSKDPDPDDPENNEPLYRIPYYLENFLLILDTVLGDKYYHSLFNEEDRISIAKFQSLSEAGQKLYVRLFQRNHRWLLQGKIKYPKIAEDLTDTLNELVLCGLLLDTSHLTSLGDTLAVLPAPEVRNLAKSLKLGSANTQKEALVTAILTHSRQNGIGSFFSRGGGNCGKHNMILKRARSLLDACYKLERACRGVFIRVIMLFGLHRSRGEDEEDAVGQQFVFQMLMSTIGRVRYPQYTVCRQAKVFKDRESFLRFGTALQIETDLAEALANKDWEAASKLYQSAKPTAEQILSLEESVEYDLSLPAHLQVYTSGAVYTRILTQGVELLQFKKQYREAAQQLEQLLEPGLYHRDYRGRMYERLALNLDHHLKQHNKALDVIRKALNDPCVRTGHRLALLQRAQRICQTNSKNKFIKDRWREFEGDPMNSVQEAPKVTIEGCRVSCGQQGPLYIHGDPGQSESVTLLKHVEDVALAHYRDQGYTQGLHGEGGTFTCLFALFMWDIIFCDGVPDTFYNPFQIYPLDWRSDSFYQRREVAITDRLAEIRAASSQDLEQMVQACWEDHQDTLCVGMNWDRFTGLEQAKGLVRCIGSQVLAAIFERMGRRMRNTTGGVPDLAVWNPETGAFKMVEVKGPGDRLSTKQILWLDYLITAGVQAEVCHVQAVSSKKLRM